MHMNDAVFYDMVISEHEHGDWDEEEVDSEYAPPTRSDPVPLMNLVKHGRKRIRKSRIYSQPTRSM
jgi:hypothetical protein